MDEAGGRLFVDVAGAWPAREPRRPLDVLSESDPLHRDALQTVVDRGDFIPSLPDERPAGLADGGGPPRSKPIRPSSPS